MSKTLKELKHSCCDHTFIQATANLAVCTRCGAEEHIDLDQSDLDFTLESLDDTSINNGGSTDYYKLNPEWTDLQNIIEDRNMNFSQGNILKAAFTFNTGRHGATSYERELNKIIWFANRELKRLKGN